MAATLSFDPIKLVLEIYDEHYGAPCEVVWREGMKSSPGDCWGCTDYEYSPPLVSLDVALPMVGVVEVLSHELAHVAAGHRAGHGKKWQAIFDDLHKRYCARVAEMQRSEGRRRRVDSEQPKHPRPAVKGRKRGRVS